MERMKPDEIRSFSARHKARWDGLRKNAPDAKMVKTTLHSVYYLALGFEVLRDYGQAADIYRTVAKNNPEEADRVVDRLEALLAKDHQNAALRAAVGDLWPPGARTRRRSISRWRSRATRAPRRRWRRRSTRASRRRGTSRPSAGCWCRRAWLPRTPPAPSRR
jgi:hypothetical protein